MGPTGKTRATLSGLLAVGALALAAPSPAQAAPCVGPNVYPGDAAAKSAIAFWMARGAAEREIPGELPVMAALVESGLQNLDHGDADAAGFFQMRKDIWNRGEYFGYPTNPDLQLKWFIDQAHVVRAAAIADGDSSFGADPAGWGEWIADIERPAEQYRGRYQPRLAEARELIGELCGDPVDPPLPPVGGPCHGEPATIVGTPASETLRGSPKADVIVALGGDDTIRGLGAGDLICGGEGADKLIGGSGADELYGGSGRDRLRGGAGNDKLAGGPGKDDQQQ